MFLKINCYGVIVSVLWSLTSSYAFAQIAWWHSIGSSGTGENVEQHVIHNDDVYACGSFERSVTLGHVTLTSKGESDIFLYRAKSDGTVVWAKSLGGSNFDGDVGLGVDPDGNVYLAGGFIDKLYLGNSLLLSAGNSGWNSFFSKFDENGNLLWTKGILAASPDSEVRVWGNISVNNNGFALAATFYGSITVDGSPVGGTNVNSHLLIARFDLAGNLVWSKFPDGARDCNEIYLDNLGNCYLTGPFHGTIKFDDYSLTGNPNYSDVYLAKLDPAGQTLWVNGGIKTGSRMDNNRSMSLTVDLTGNVYFVGMFKGDVRFDPIIVQGNTDPEYSVVDTFLAKYNADGQVMFAVNFGDGHYAFGSDIVYSPFGLFVLGTSASGQFCYSKVDLDAPGNAAPVHVNAYGVPLQLWVVDEKRFYISGFASMIKNQIANGGLDGILIKVEACVAGNPGNVSPIAGAASLCRGDEVTYSVGPVENADHFVWTIPPLFTPNGSIRTPVGTITLQAASAGSASISVSAENECNQGNDTSSTIIKIDDYLQTPIIAKDHCDRALSVSAAGNIEWFRNDELVVGVNAATIAVVDSGVYKVRIHNSCHVQESPEVSVYPVIDGVEPFFPNVITPNNDHMNDSFRLDNSLLYSTLKIFNRWGEIVYATSSYENSWQGESVSSGVYYYYVENSCYTKPFKGNVQVIK